MLSPFTYLIMPMQFLFTVGKSEFSYISTEGGIQSRRSYRVQYPFMAVCWGGKNLCYFLRKVQRYIAKRYHRYFTYGYIIFGRSCLKGEIALFVLLGFFFLTIHICILFWWKQFLSLQTEHYLYTYT